MVFIEVFDLSISGPNMFKSHYSKSYEKLRKSLIDMRKDANLSQVQLAEKLEVTQQFISKYETGERNLDFIEITLVCKACGKDVSDLKIGIRS